MKKKVWLLGVAVAALTSCTQNEVLEIPESRTIGFESHVDKSTRAVHTVDVDNNSLKGFYAYCAYGKKPSGVFVATAFNYMDAKKVYYYTKNDGGVTTEGWEYANPLPWVEDSYFRFAGYADGVADADENDCEAKIPVEGGTDTRTVTFLPIINQAKINEYANATVNAETDLWGLEFENYVPTNKDLIAAVPFEKEIGTLTTSPDQVNMSFKHLLAKVVFEFTNTSTSGTYLSIDPIQFQIDGTGDCLVVYHDNGETGANRQADPIIFWKTSTPETAILFPQTGTANIKWNHGSIQEVFYVLPQSNDIIIPAINVYSLDGNGNATKSHTLTNVSLSIGSPAEWKAGYTYRYYANVTPGSFDITFTGSVSAWQDNAGRDENIGNQTNSTSEGQ